MKPKKTVVLFDPQNGFYLKPDKTLSKFSEKHPLVMVGNLEEARRLSANLNFQNEKD
jgi:hypothetical protein